MGLLRLYSAAATHLAAHAVVEAPGGSVVDETVAHPHARLDLLVHLRHQLEGILNAVRVGGLARCKPNRSEQ